MRLYEFLTIGSIIDDAIREALGSTQSLVSELQPIPLIDEVQRIDSDFLAAAYTMGPNQGWSFEEAFKEYVTFGGTTLNGALSAGDASVVLTSASSFPSSGRIVIDTARGALDFVDYSAKASNTLTVDASGEAVGMAHATGEAVEPLYALPANFDKLIDLHVDETPYFLVDTATFPLGTAFRLVGRYLLFPDGHGVTHVHLRYKRGTIFVTNTAGNITTNRATETNIPKNFARYPVDRLKAHIYRVRERYDKARECDLLADRALRHALAYDLNSDSNDGLIAG